ncbi:hypothetical protein [Paenibacillus solani]|uniref:hypothetical protein n=1 Tax=Paenibacillus solani TaxID=1705565 RepID=UPI003D28ABFC
MTHIDTVVLVIAIVILGVLIGALFALRKTSDTEKVSQALIYFLFPVAFCLTGAVILIGIFN